MLVSGIQYFRILCMCNNVVAAMLVGALDADPSYTLNSNIIKLRQPFRLNVYYVYIRLWNSVIRGRVNPSTKKKEKNELSLNFRIKLMKLIYTLC